LLAGGLAVAGSICVALFVKPIRSEKLASICLQKADRGILYDAHTAEGIKNPLLSREGG
jgi:hypothetical protein